MKITVHTAASNAYWNIMQVSSINRAMYCTMHKYQLSLRKYDDNADTQRLERVQFILDDLEYCDWLFFIDCDALITNMNIKVEDLIAKYSEYEFVIANDVNGINNGVMLFKSTPEVKNFLKETIKYTTKDFNDQNAMVKYMNNTKTLKFKVVHQREFNSMPYFWYQYKDDGGGTWEYGDFICHFPGFTLETKYKLMLDFNNNITMLDFINSKVKAKEAT